MAKSKGSKAKNKSAAGAVGKDKSGSAEAAVQNAGSSSNPRPTPDALIEKAQILLAQHNTPLALQFLNRALETDPNNLEGLELAGVAECEEGDVEKGREHLLKLVQLMTTTSPPCPAPSPYLYLAQTASSAHEALMYYETAINLFSTALSAAASSGAGNDQDVEGMKKDYVTALIAMIEIWMSDLCFDPAAPSTCDMLIGKALEVLPSDMDVRLSLASIRISQGLSDVARKVIDGVYEEVVAASSEGSIDKLPPIPTRTTLVRLLLEYSLFNRALRVVEIIRAEDELDVEGAYLEGWCWYLRGEAAEGGDNAEEKAEERDEAEEKVSKEECWTEAMGSLLEAQSLHQEHSHPDEGILSHIAELLPVLEAAGIEVPIEEEGEDDEGEDVDMA